ncbi:tax1-binding protein 1 homolog A isoform X3 [Ictalurus furcatus]|uniref:tax1-binding protein 1 homolog A isoform X3 n=1 Tax=Ictalurus furcatus TaxID=66913 RepID=UPI00234FDCF7|nr:tax1-binding protein 1 homolog A isoform X3 [Ictalurus furcatus]
MMSSASDAAVSPGGGGGASVMEMSNFAHVIFQNVGKSFLPQAALECHYTLTPFITPHPKDWVGIFKVGWSSARDYYTFLWSPMPENYTEGSTVQRVLVFQGYYVPRSDGEFYQFCYVTHMGEIRGASTPFQFRAATPTGEELLTVEDDGNSDILVVTTKTGLLERRVEEVQQECRELQKAVCLLTQERDQLKEEQRQHNQERQQRLREEREKAHAGVKQLEQDLLGVTQKAVLKETELDCLRSKLQKVTMERDHLEVQLKNERDERELYKSHMRSAELENTKLSAELQMLKAVELNREVTISQYQEEIHRLHTERNAHAADTERAEPVSELEAELQKEVEELKLRLQMAAEHYKEKYRECQRLRRQVTKLTQKQETQQEDCNRNDASTDPAQEPNPMDAELPPTEKKPENQEHVEGKMKEGRDEGEGEKTEGSQEEQQEEGEETSVSVEVELARMEERWREQCVINDNLKLLLADEEQRFKAQLAEKDREVFSLRESLAEVTKEKGTLEEELRSRAGQEEAACGQRSEVREPVVLRYPLPYPHDSPPLPLVPQQPAELQYGNPYCEPHTRDGADGALSPQQSCRPPPVAPPPWVGPVVCSQPLRSLSPPDGLENPAEERPNGGDGEAPAVCDHQSPESNEGGSGFCFDARTDVHKRCPLCEVIFPPHFEQRSFERHVESHWRECPVCSEQFPLDCQQQLYEKHVLTHFDSNVLNFHNYD